jgi:hypothetical protein
MTDPFTHFYQIKRAIAAAGLHDDALAMDGVLAGSSFEGAWGFVGRLRENIRKRDYFDALASMKAGHNCSDCATDLYSELLFYAKHHYANDCASRAVPAGKRAALFKILSGDSGKVLTIGSYRKKLAKVRSPVCQKAGA